MAIWAYEILAPQKSSFAEVIFKIFNISDLRDISLRNGSTLPPKILLNPGPARAICACVRFAVCSSDRSYRHFWLSLRIFFVVDGTNCEWREKISGAMCKINEFEPLMS